MVKLIVGRKGKGKTKHLLDQVNKEVKSADGNLVYLDKSTKHMFELDKHVRLINVTEYPLESSDSFIGFLCGIISQDHDLEQVYLDSFLKVAHLDENDNDAIEHVVSRLTQISDKYNINVYISLSKDEKDLPEAFKEMILISL